MTIEEEQATLKDRVNDIWNSANPEALDQLYSFGQFLMSEVQQRSGQLDTKMATMLGLSATTAAFLLAGNGVWQEATHGFTLLRGVVLIAAILALACMISCFLGLRLQKWSIPSESDWLNTQLLSGNPEELKRFHVISLLETHNKHATANRKKSQCALVAQWMLALAALVVGGTLVGRVLLLILG